MLFEVLDRPVAMLDIGLDAAVVDLFMGNAADVADGLLGRILAAHCGDAVVAGNPDATTGNRRGATEVVALFHDLDLQSKVVGTQRGGHRTGSRTHHQYVATLIPLRAVRAHRACSLVVVRGAQSARILSAPPTHNIVRWD
ncbi:hypothetical protein D9M69_503490 [compost metagenome]